MMIIQEYVELLFHNYTKMLYTLPTGSGPTIGILRILVEEMGKGNNHTLFLSRNYQLNNQYYQIFASIINKDLSLNGINMFYENDKNSSIFFKVFNCVENSLWQNIDNIVLLDVDLRRNNEFTINLIDNIKNVNNKIIFINCNIEDKVLTVIKRRLNQDDFYIKYHFNLVLRKTAILDEINRVKQDIRNKKLKKITETICD